jgi:hypothetical protein
VSSSADQTVVLADDFSSSQVLSLDLPVVSTSGREYVGIGFDCNGDRADDGQDDLLVGSAAWGDSGIDYTLAVFDGPLVPGSTLDDATGLLGTSSPSPSEGLGGFTWASGLGRDGGDGVLYGSLWSYYHNSVARFVDDPVGTIAAEDVTATYSLDDPEDYVVGSTVRSADVNGDGVAELLIGVKDTTADHLDGAVVLAAAGEGELSLDDYPQIRADHDTHYDDGGTGEGHYGVYGDSFVVGDADEDGYQDMYVNLLPRSLWSDHGYTVGAVFYGPLGAMEASDAGGFIEYTSYDGDNYWYASFPGDFNGDGASGDLIVTRSDVYLFADPPSGYHTEASATTIPLYSGTDGDAYCSPGTAVGDVNGDGFGDLACTASGDDEVATDSGAIYLLFGGSW